VQRKPTILPAITSPKEVRGLASWLRTAARVRQKVELTPSTALIIADLLEASVPSDKREAA
jgi:hypothetical protein